MFRFPPSFEEGELSVPLLKGLFLGAHAVGLAPVPLPSFMHGFYCCRAECSQTLRSVTTDEGLYYRAAWRLCKHGHFCASSELHRILDLAVIKGAYGLRVVDASVFVRSYPSSSVARYLAQSVVTIHVRSFELALVIPSS